MKACVNVCSCECERVSVCIGGMCVGERQVGRCRHFCSLPTVEARLLGTENWFILLLWGANSVVYEGLLLSPFS